MTESLQAECFCDLHKPYGHLEGSQCFLYPLICWKKLIRCSLCIIIITSRLGQSSSQKLIDIHNPTEQQTHYCFIADYSACSFFKCKKNCLFILFERNCPFSLFLSLSSRLIRQHHKSAMSKCQSVSVQPVCLNKGLLIMIMRSQKSIMKESSKSECCMSECTRRWKKEVSRKSNESSSSMLHEL